MTWSLTVTRCSSFLEKPNLQACRGDGGELCLSPISVGKELGNKRAPLFHFQLLQPMASLRRLVSGIQPISAHRGSPIRDLRASGQLCNQQHRIQVRIRLWWPVLRWWAADTPALTAVTPPSVSAALSGEGTGASWPRSDPGLPKGAAPRGRPVRGSRVEAARFPRQPRLLLSSAH